MSEVRESVWRKASSIWHAALLAAATLCVAITMCGCATVTKPLNLEEMAQETSDLPAWEADAASTQAVMAFVHEVVDETSPSYRPPEERVAVVELDGALLCDTMPTRLDAWMMAERCTHDEDFEPTDELRGLSQDIASAARASAWSNDLTARVAQLAPQAYEGMTTEQYATYVHTFLQEQADCFVGLTREEALFRPMVELVSYLQASDFSVYVVTDAEETLARTLVSAALDLPASHVLGTPFGLRARHAAGAGDEHDPVEDADGDEEAPEGDEEAPEGDETPESDEARESDEAPADEDAAWETGDALVVDGAPCVANAGMQRVYRVAQNVGARPILAVAGTQDGTDLLAYVADDDAPTLCLVVLNDDDQRTWGSEARSGSLRALANEREWTAVSVRDDWLTVFDGDVTTGEWIGPDLLVLVNQEHALPDGWESGLDLVESVNPKGVTERLDRIAYDAFLALQEDLASQGVSIYLNSCYRSVEQQQAIADSFTAAYGDDYTREYVAVPGHSEHHTGLALDAYLVDNGVPVLTNEDIYAHQATWDVVHALLPTYGFVLRYPQGKEDVTGYTYEPWHFRYVGEQAAREMSERGLTLEEYLGVATSEPDAQAQTADEDFSV